MTDPEYCEFMAVNLGRKADIKAYTVEPSMLWQPKKLDEAGNVVGNGDPFKLLFMEHGYGNESGLVNAPQVDPF
jgi:hypothetical protein